MSHRFSVFLGLTLAALACSALTPTAGAQNLFVADFIGSSIYEYTPRGAQTTFASGLNTPGFLTFAPAAVPEPGSMALMLGMSVAGSAFVYRRLRRSHA